MIEYPPVVPDSVLGGSATLLRSRGFYVLWHINGITEAAFGLPMALWVYSFGIPPFQ